MLLDRNSDKLLGSLELELDLELVIVFPMCNYITNGTFQLLQNICMVQMEEQQSKFTKEMFISDTYMILYSVLEVKSGA